MSERIILQKSIEQAWKVISPAWSLQQFVASNPLATMYTKKFQDAVVTSYASLCSEQFLESMRFVNQETVMWMEVFFDRGQATLSMPYRELGLYQSCRELLIIQYQQEGISNDKIVFLQQLPDDSYAALENVLSILDISSDDYAKLFKALLITLPGWASYIVYCVDWMSNKSYLVSKVDYLLIRLIMLYVKGPGPSILLADMYEDCLVRQKVEQLMKVAQVEEKKHQEFLENALQIVNTDQDHYQAQFVFCIDVRSERIRRNLEAQGNYETFGYAGFFGLPIRVYNQLTKREHDAFPALLTSRVKIKESVYCDTEICQKLQTQKISLKHILKTIYKALKYTFIAPFALVEILGPYSFFWMLLRLVAPWYAARLKNSFYRRDIVKQVSWPQVALDEYGYGISLQQQCEYALQALRMIGLTRSFSDVIVLVSHISHTENNAYETALNCGACGGCSGLTNAKLLATILNTQDVRNYLAQHAIVIPQSTYVLAAEHITTSDEIVLYDNQSFKHVNSTLLEQMHKDLRQAQYKTLFERSELFDNQSLYKVAQRGFDWSQIRPEWGLVNNASMIVGPRWLSKKVSLKGEAFLHSYDWSIDGDQSLLRIIMTAPMVVAHWINMQYFFSTFDNRVYGSGSKITQNITGKFGVMQGNASDLMTGLPLQSVYSSNINPYHTVRRLIVVIYAPREYVQRIVDTEEQVKQLVANQWLYIRCIDPSDHRWYFF